MRRHRIRLLIAIGAVLGVTLGGCGVPPESRQPDVGQPSPPDALEVLEVQYHHWTDLRRHTFSETGEDFDPDVSSDRRWLAFASTRDSVRPDIFIKEIDARVSTRLTTHPASERYPAVSPDGSMVAFCTARNGNWDIYIAPTHGPRALIEIAGSSLDEIAPTWSPDARYLCYSVRDRYGVWNLWILDRTTQQMTRLGPGLFPSWSPDGEWIAFQRPQGRGQHWYSIWRIRPTGTEPTQVLSRPEWAAIHPAWSTDGSRIAFATVRKSRLSRVMDRYFKADDIWTIGADASDLTNLTDHPAADWSPTWAADGRIYFTSEMEGRRNIWSLRPRTMDFTTDSP